MSLIEPAVGAQRCEGYRCGEREKLVRVYIPSEGPRVLCDTHARKRLEALGTRCDGTFMSSEGDMADSTGFPDRRLRGRRNGTGKKPRPGAGQAMPANDGTPSEGESVSGEPCDWESLGRRLYRARLERLGTDVDVTARLIADRIGTGESVGEREVQELRGRASELAELADLLADALEGDATSAGNSVKREGSQDGGEPTR